MQDIIYTPRYSESTTNELHRDQGREREMPRRQKGRANGRPRTGIDAAACRAQTGTSTVPAIPDQAANSVHKRDDVRPVAYLYVRSTVAHKLRQLCSLTEGWAQQELAVSANHVREGRSMAHPSNFRG